MGAQMSEEKKTQNSTYPVSFNGVVQERGVVLEHGSTWNRLNNVDEKERELMANEDAPQPVPNQTLKQNYSIMKPARRGPGNARKRPTSMSDINP